jgi:phosphoenolpyruvate-protein kinase (PTS system EI component)
MDKAFLEQMRKKVEKELTEREISVVEFWKEEIEKLLHKKTESLSALQQDLRDLSSRMENRLNVIKRSSEF